jgi:hypothetical protein
MSRDPATAANQAGGLGWPRSSAIEACGRTSLVPAAHVGRHHLAPNIFGRPIALDLAASRPTCNAGPRASKQASMPARHGRQGKPRKDGKPVGVKE